MKKRWYGYCNCLLFNGYSIITSWAILGLWYSLILNEPSWVKADGDVAGGASNTPINGERNRET